MGAGVDSRALVLIDPDGVRDETALFSLLTGKKEHAGMVGKHDGEGIEGNHLARRVEQGQARADNGGNTNAEQDLTPI